MQHVHVAVFLSAVLLAGCGQDAETAAAGATTAGGEAQPLDWALLLPIETEGLVQVDLARMRRSPYRASFQPVIDELIREADDGSVQRALGELIERTDLVMVAFVPEGQEDELVILARGRYQPDEIARLEAASPEHEAELTEIDGHRVWVGEGDDGVTLSQIVPSTLAMTASLDRMRGLIARTRMARATRRWPPALRDLVEATNLEHATFGLALANRSLGTEDGQPIEMSLAGTADADGPLDIAVLVELGDATLAAASTIFFQGLIRELAQAGGESFAVGQLADLTQIEAEGSRVRASVHADPTAAAQLVPGLMGIVRDGLAGEEEVPSVISPMPTPL